MSERLNKCPLCKSGHFLNDREVIDHAVSKEKFILCRCTQCNLLFTNPRPKKKEIEPYYEFPQYYSHTDSTTTFTEKIYNRVRKVNIRKKVRLIESLIPKGKILDYGCGAGFLLQALKTRGWEIDGMEPNAKARKKASLLTNQKIYKSTAFFEEKPKYDVITLFHVLEHIHSLRKTLNKLKKALNPNGYILIAVPNYKSLDAVKYQESWAGWDVPRHLYHFSNESIVNLADQFNLAVHEKIPMIFDSYYVSLLSEKYKNPESNAFTNYINAMRLGWQSNQKAKKTKEYSSILYILKKK